MPFPLAPHHVQLVAACYPPSAALLTAGPEYKPNAQELSRLTYYASNRPSKIAKLGSELEKRALADARKAASGNVKPRASLLITLNIFKALIHECRRDLSMLSSSLMSALDAVLAQLSHDLEVTAKAASVFAAWATYTDGQLLGIDQALTRDYISTLSRISTMCLFEVKNNDIEERNRARLIGLGALTGAIASEALYNSSTQFKSQVSMIVPALLVNLLQVDIAALNHESDSKKKAALPLTTFLDDFRSRPLLERRAASIHAHIDGDEGPTSADVASATLQAFACLFSQSNGPQVSLVLQALLDGLGIHDGWKQAEHCCWLTQKAIEWTQYQYRFAVPSRLVDRLLEAQEDPRPSDLHRTLTLMITTAFTAPVPLVNLSTSDVCSNLSALILRRVAINLNDELLPDVVRCVGALGTHIYYADQIHDLACEIIGRLSHIESHGINGKGRPTSKGERERAMALRCLVACLGQLIRSSTKPLQQHTASSDARTEEGHGNPGSIPAKVHETDDIGEQRKSVDTTSTRATLPHRTRIAPDVWQETLSLLCDESFAVRSEYARVLTLYLTTEIRQDLGVNSAVEGLSRMKSTKTLEDGPFQRARSLRSIGMGDSTVRFLHALHAMLFVQATAPQLGVLQSSPSSTPSEEDLGEGRQRRSHQINVSITPSTPRPDQSFSEQDDQLGENSQGTQSSRRKSLGQAVQTRKLHRIRRLIDAGGRRHSRHLQLDTEVNSACLSDYAHILDILNTVHERTSARAIVTGVPMLLKLRSWCETDCASQVRQTAIKEIIARQWQTISRIWDIPALIELTKSVKLNASFPYPPPEVDFPRPENAVPLSSLSGETEQLPWCGDEIVIQALASSTSVQIGTGLDEAALAKRLASAWTPDQALNDSIESFANGDSPRPEHGNPLLKISPALMHISNLSLQSLTRSNRGVSVNDLRDALEGRGCVSNIALPQGRAPSIASIGATHSGASGESAASPSVWSAGRPRQHMLSGESSKDVKNVLDKLGIGANKGTGSLKAPASPVRPPSARSALIPPYKS